MTVDYKLILYSSVQVKDFSNFDDAIFTLLRTILGDFDFHAIEQANRFLGPVFFLAYVFFVFFVLLVSKPYYFRESNKQLLFDCQLIIS